MVRSKQRTKQDSMGTDLQTIPNKMSQKTK